MKQKDIVIIIVVIVFSGIASLFLCSLLIGTPTSKQQSAEVVVAISSDFKLPDSNVFNEFANNPTRLINIAPNKNDNPFSDKSASQ